MMHSGFWNWNTLRLVDFIIIFICWIILMYRGVYKIITSPALWSWDRFMNLLWCFAAWFGIGEILYDGHVPGGWRLFITTGVALMQLWVVLYRSPFTPPSIPVPRKYKKNP